jgi:ketosteroid isomerase-like protein
MSAKIARSLVLVTAFGLSALPAVAATKAPDAQMHFKAIAGANLDRIMSQYAPDATLHWIGGPLNGTYHGKREIKEAWGKFIHKMGKTHETASAIDVVGDPKGMTVTANVHFVGKPSVPVRYVLVYRDRKIVDEVWQINAKKSM